MFPGEPRGEKILRVQVIIFAIHIYFGEKKGSAKNTPTKALE